MAAPVALSFVGSVHCLSENLQTDIGDEGMVSFRAFTQSRPFDLLDDVVDDWIEHLKKPMSLIMFAFGGGREPLTISSDNIQFPTRSQRMTNAWMSSPLTLPIHGPAPNSPAAVIVVSRSPPRGKGSSRT